MHDERQKGSGSAFDTDTSRKPGGERSVQQADGAEELLDAALGSYANPRPSDGFEQRVLARLHASSLNHGDNASRKGIAAAGPVEATTRALWRWVAGIAAVLLCCASLFVPKQWTHGNRRDQHRAVARKSLGAGDQFTPSRDTTRHTSAANNQVGVRTPTQQKAQMERDASYRLSPRKVEARRHTAGTELLQHAHADDTDTGKPFVSAPLSEQERLMLQLAATAPEALPKHTETQPLTIAPIEISAIPIKPLEGTVPSRSDQQ